MNPPPLKTYVLSWLALLALLALTTASAYVHLGNLNFFLNISIAAAKALLVMWAFMHLARGTALQRLTAAIGFLWLAILATLTLADSLTR